MSHYVDIESFENGKENYHPIKSGRSSKSLVKEPFESSQKLESERSLYEAQIADAQEGGDLNTWLRYLKWTQENYPTCGKSSKFLYLLERCMQRFLHDPRYKNDYNFLQVWLQYTDFISNPIDIFNFMEFNGIGVDYAQFWKSYGEVLESNSRFDEALITLERGVALKAKPEEKMKMFKMEFESRMFTRFMKSQKLSLDTKLEVKDENDRPRFALGTLQGATGSTRQYGESARFVKENSSYSTKNIVHRDCFVPHVDSDEQLNDHYEKSPTVGMQWKHIPLERYNMNENQDFSDRWSNWSMPQDPYARAISSRVLSQEKNIKSFEVFSEESKQDEPVRKKNKISSFVTDRESCKYRPAIVTDDMNHTASSSNAYLLANDHPYSFVIKSQYYEMGSNDAVIMSNNKWEIPGYDRTRVYPGDGKEYSFEELRMKNISSCGGEKGDAFDVININKNYYEIGEVHVTTSRSGDVIGAKSNNEMRNNCYDDKGSSITMNKSLGSKTNKQVTNLMNGINMMNPSTCMEINQSELLNDCNETTTQTVGSMTVHTREALAVVLDLFDTKDLKGFADTKEASRSHEDGVIKSDEQEVTSSLVIPFESKEVQNIFSVYEDDDAMEMNGGEYKGMSGMKHEDEATISATVKLNRLLNEEQGREVRKEFGVREDDTMRLGDFEVEGVGSFGNFDETLNITGLYRELNGKDRENSGNYGDREYLSVMPLNVMRSRCMGRGGYVNPWEVVGSITQHEILENLLGTGLEDVLIDCRGLRKPELTESRISIKLKEYEFNVVECMVDGGNTRVFVIEDKNGKLFFCRYGSIYEYYISSRIFYKLSLNADLMRAMGRFNCLARFLMVFVFDDCSLLVFEYVQNVMPFGRLLELRSSGEDMGLIDESISLYCLSQFCILYGMLHELGFSSCGSIESSNFWMVNDDGHLMVGANALDASWLNCGLMLGNYSNILDMECFVDGVRFVGLPSLEDGVKLEGLPWASDVWRILRIVHYLLYAKDIQTVTENQRIKSRIPFKMFWCVDLWKSIFESMLNVDIMELNDDGSSALLRRLDVVVKKYFGENFAQMKALFMQMSRISNRYRR